MGSLRLRFRQSPEETFTRGVVGAAVQQSVLCLCGRCERRRCDRRVLSEARQRLLQQLCCRQVLASKCHVRPRLLPRLYPWGGEFCICLELKLPSKSLLGRGQGVFAN